MKMARVIGHRGAAAYAPENTLAGIRLAAELGCTWIEADATLLADGNVVLLHDDQVDRCTDGQGAVTDFNWQDLSRLDAGSWFQDSRYVGEKVPLFEEALTLCRELSLGFNIELKTHIGEGEALAKAVSTLLPLGADNILVSSFDEVALSRFHHLRPEIPVGMIYDDLPANWQVVADRLSLATIHLWERHLNQDLVGQIKATGREVYAYTLNTSEEAKRLFQMGVDGVFSDYPDLNA